MTTAGFEDTIAIGRQTRSKLYDWFVPLPVCLVPRPLRFGVPERVSAEGEILRTPTEEELQSLVNQVRGSGAEAIAISLLFSLCQSRDRAARGSGFAPASVYPSLLRTAFCPSFANMSAHRRPSSTRTWRPGCRTIYCIWSKA